MPNSQKCKTQPDKIQSQQPKKLEIFHLVDILEVTLQADPLHDAMTAVALLCLSC